MIARFFVAGPLPGQNEIVKAAKSGGRGRVYSAQKEAFTNRCGLAALASPRFTPIDRLVNVRCEWIEAAKRRDPDNVSAGIKFVLDGLVESGQLAGDGWRYVNDISHSRRVGAVPGVWVTLEEAT